MDVRYNQSKSWHTIWLNNTPTFIRLPRNHSLEMTKDSHDLCHAIQCCMKAQKKSVKRGSKCEVFANTSNEYMCVGTQACRTEKGLNCGYHCIKKGFTNEHWDILFKTLKKGKHAFDAYSPTDVIHHVHEAKNSWVPNNEMFTNIRSFERVMQKIQWNRFWYQCVSSVSHRLGF